MNPFPKNHELISFFEVEPEVTDTDVVWFYNYLAFRGDEGGIKYAVAMHPSMGEVTIRIGEEGDPVVNLSLAEVEAMRLHEGPSGAFMILEFLPGSKRGVLKLRLRPKPAIEWSFEVH